MGASFQSRSWTGDRGADGRGWKPLPLEIRGDDLGTIRVFIRSGVDCRGAKGGGKRKFPVVRAASAAPDMWNPGYDRIAFSPWAYGTMAEEMEGAAVLPGGGWV